MRKAILPILLLIPLLSSAAQEKSSALIVWIHMTLAVGKHHSVVGSARMIVREKTLPISFKLMTPSYYFMDTNSVQLIGPGTKHFLVLPSQKRYADEGDHFELPTTLLVGLDSILEKMDHSYTPVGPAVISTLSGEKVYGFTMKGPEDEMTLYVDAKTYLPVCADHVSEGKDSGGEILFVKVVYDKLDFETKLTPADFAWSPPSDYQLMPSQGG
jgi:hypothetical protein